MGAGRRGGLAPGIISVVQTPFVPTGSVDFDSLGNLIEDGIRSGVDGFLAPAVASEAGYLTTSERERILRFVADTTDGRVPFMVGASDDEPETCRHFASIAETIGANAYLVSVPTVLYGRPADIVAYFSSIASTTEVSLLIQDLEWNGPGLDIETIARLQDALPTLLGLKIETVPAGPKYSAVRNAFGRDFFIAGGWAVPQWIEALDRGIDAMIPESAMIGVYAEVLRRYRAGRRGAALALFRELLPVLAYTNQEITTSIAFFKRLLVRRGVFQHETMRQPGFAWDAWNARIADELIDLYLSLEERVT